MKKGKKIVVIGLKGLPAFGGAAAVGENIINQLSANFDFTVYSTSSHTELQTGRYNEARQIVFNRISHKKLNTLYYYILSAFHAVLFGKYDLVHLHHNDAAFLIPFLKIKYKVIVTTHGVHNSGVIEKWKRYKWFFQGQIKFFLKYANRITCVSKTEKAWLANVHQLQATYIPNGIHLSNKGHKKSRTETTLFFGAGRIVSSKGCAVMLRSLQQICFKGRIQIAGDLNNQSSEYREYILNLAQGLNVEFLGLIKDKSQLFGLMHNSDLFIFPSSAEAMSMMLLEAASVNVPIICSDIKENMDLFNSKEVLFFKTGSYSDLGEKIHWALNHTKEMELKARNATEKLVKNYLWQDIAEQYRQVYLKYL